MELRARLQGREEQSAQRASDWLKDWEQMVYAGEPTHQELRKLLERLKSR
jgi:hypothetical protein